MRIFRQSQRIGLPLDLRERVGIEAAVVEGHSLPQRRIGEAAGVDRRVAVADRRARR
jgi:hypothetical protein